MGEGQAWDKTIAYYLDKLHRTLDYGCELALDTRRLASMLVDLKNAFIP
jgi:hypothetical protein